MILEMKATPFTCLLVALPLVVLLQTPSMAADARIEGLILEKGARELVVLDVESYERRRIPLSSTAKIERKNHKGITFDDLQVGWYIDVNQETAQTGQSNAKLVRVKMDRSRPVMMNSFLESHPTQDRMVVDGQDIRTKNARIVRKKYFPGDLMPGLKARVRGIRLDDGSVEAAEIEVEPNGQGLWEETTLTLCAKHLRKFNRKPELLKGSDVQKYVETVGTRLIPAAIRDMIEFRFQVVRNPAINAFAFRSFAWTPGSRRMAKDRIVGTVYLYTGLLKVLQNEAQLAAILGHEMAHITHEHSSRGLAKKFRVPGRRSVALGRRVKRQGKIGAMDSFFEGIKLGMLDFSVINGHGKIFEAQADRVGLRYLYEGGYAPMEASRAWDLLTKKGNEQNSVSYFFYSRHATHLHRKRNLFEEISLNYSDHVNCQSNCKQVVNEEAYTINVLKKLD